MQKPNYPYPAARPKPPSKQPWPAEIEELLAQAAALGAHHGIEAEAFMKGAWSAYVDARPGYREHLEEMQLRAELDEMRASGRVGSA